jgi:Cu(I)/Ag(I) efflux system protein CusF
MKRIAVVSLCILIASATSTLAFGQAAGKPMDMKPAEASKATASHTGTGVVQSVDPAKGSVTLDHDPIKSLNWPAMTMGFKVGDPKLFAKLKKGDKVQFTFVQSGRDAVITSIQ